MAADVKTVLPLPLACDGNTNPETDSSLATQIQNKNIDIVDIRAGGQALDLKEAIRSGMRECNAEGLRSLPSLLLWNEQGLKYFEHVTYTSEYYLTNAEIELLQEHSLHLARNIESDTIILELGSGCLRKTKVFLQAIDDLGKKADYYALDLDLKELNRTLEELDPSHFKHVSCHGLLGTYDDGKSWLSQGINSSKRKCILSLGSTMGSFTRPEASDFWRQWANVLRQGVGGTREFPDAKIIIGLDGCKDAGKVRTAYNDSSGANRRFILNVLGSANEHLGYKAFNPDDWTVKGEWDAHGGRHVQYLIALKDTSFEDQRLHEGERLVVVYSHKYDEEDKRQLWKQSQLNEVDNYMHKEISYGLHVLSP